MDDPHFTVERIGPNALRVTMSGALDAARMEAGLDAFATEMEGMAHGDMLMIDQGAQLPTPGALAVEFQRWPQMMAMLQQIDRVALVSHNPLLRTMAAVESALLPGYTVRCFHDEASARAWLFGAHAPA